MRRLLVLTTVALASSPVPASALQAELRVDRERTDSVSIARGFGADLALLGGGVLHVATAPTRWDGHDWLALPALGVAVVGLSALDADVRDMMRRNQGDVADALTGAVEPLGADYSFAVVAGLYVTGVVRKDSKVRSMAVEALASSIVAGGVVTPVLQYVTGRYRPWEGEDPHTWSPFSRNISFPSGHTTQAFAVASVIAARHDATWVKVTAYALASAVGVSRVYHDAHHLSDVAAAALIGTAVGTSVARFGRGRALSLNPSGAGVRLAFHF